MLHLVCGKAASGKSTLTARLGEAAGTVVVAEDDWLSALYGDQMQSLPDYVRCAARLRVAMRPHIIALLKAGLSVVLDFPANTVETRQWMREIVQSAGADHRLHYLDVSDEACWVRLQARNARGDHPFSVTREQFARLLEHFVPPAEGEGLTIVRHTAR
ncbi:AAA family ATPase [Sinisalibacter lacisalsi]|uniref:Cell division protein ZipA n=1 Tax=Sinisalibacter lacisalsi TaxID=1526570 RepID=A0ABQ1QM04_9RHOB|nr:ATP-binding protein [Sinisalibacter lacisalsi]GGD30539.1 cell division protein ZipA [Sinisalibacter lacisalsi]